MEIELYDPNELPFFAEYEYEDGCFNPHDPNWYRENEAFMPLEFNVPNNEMKENPK